MLGAAADVDVFPTEEQQLITEAVGRLGDELASETARWDQADRIDPEALRAVAGLGLAGMCTDAARGGSELGLAAAALALETLSRYSAALGLRVASHALGALPVLASTGLGPAEFRPWAQGDVWATPVEGIKAESAKSGAVSVLHGEAKWVVGGRDADGLVVLTETDEVHLVTGSPEGLARTPVDCLGMRGSGLAHLHFDRVSVSSPIGRVPVGARARWVALERLGRAAVGLGIGRDALVRARDHALGRQQFGQPIAGFQAIQWMLADTATEMDAAGVSVLELAAELDGGGDAHTTSLAALLLVSESALSAAQRAVQIHGGSGFVADFVVERLARDARYLGLSRYSSEDVAQTLGEMLLTAR